MMSHKFGEGKTKSLNKKTDVGKKISKSYVQRTTRKIHKQSK